MSKSKPNVAKVPVDDPLVGLFAPGIGSDIMGDVAKQAKEHLFGAHLDERSFTPGDKDERALYFLRFQQEVNGSQVFGAVADIAERVRISRDKRGVGREDDVTILSAEMDRLEQRERIKMFQAKLNEPERR